MVRYLAQHPNIFVCPIKEPHYFNSDSQHRYYFTEEKYNKLFSEASPEQTYRCEASVWYLFSKVAVENILHYNPNATFLVMLRNPVDMFFSLYSELIFGGSEVATSPSEAWELQNRRLQGRSIPKGAYAPEVLQYGEVCKLGQQAHRVDELVVREKLKFVLLDDLNAQPEQVFNEILDFLQLPKIESPSIEIANKRKRRKIPQLSKFVAQSMYLKRKLGLRKGLGMANKINNWNVTDDRVLSNEDVAQLSPKLYDFFKSDIELLSKIINRDLSHWKSKGVI
jgi:hypothetical protein